MTGWLSLAVLVAASSVLVAVLCAVAVALGVRWGDAWLDRMAMRGRVRLVLLMAVAPMAVSATILLLCFAPSVLASTGLMSDHCLQHFHDHLHLCFRHLPTIGPGATACIATAAGLVAFGAAARTAAVSLVRGLALRQSLSALARPSDEPTGSVHWVESSASLTLTVGLWRPRVFMSRGMAELLDPSELAAALAHERCHARERHGLLKLVALCGSVMHLPRVRRRLLELVSLACERRADEDAARRVGNRLSVASAILRAHRAAPRSEGPLVFALTGDGPSTITRRINAMLAPAMPSDGAVETRLLVALAGLGVVACFEVHHAVEAAISLLV